MDKSCVHLATSRYNYWSLFIHGWWCLRWFLFSFFWKKYSWYHIVYNKFSKCDHWQTLSFLHSFWELCWIESISFINFKFLCLWLSQKFSSTYKSRSDLIFDFNRMDAAIRQRGMLNNWVCNIYWGWWFCLRLKYRWYYLSRSSCGFS